VQPHLRGNDLQRLGLPPGPIYKQVFTDLLARRLDGDIQNRSQAEAYVRSRYLHQSRQ